MSNYFTSFSCRLDVGASENVDRAIAIAAELEAELEAQDVLSLGFEVERDERRSGAIGLSDGDGFGEPENVIAFVLRCAEVFDLTGRWGLWCSSSRTDGFGGGAHVLDLGARRTLAWMDCDQWLGALLDPTTTQMSAWSCPDASMAPRGKGDRRERPTSLLAAKMGRHRSAG